MEISTVAIIVVGFVVGAVALGFAFEQNGISFPIGVMAAAIMFFAGIDRQAKLTEDMAVSRGWGERIQIVGEDGKSKLKFQWVLDKVIEEGKVAE